MRTAAVVVGGALAVVALAAAPAIALEQPDGTPIPSDMGCDGGTPTGLAPTFACICETPGVCNIGDPCPGDVDPNSCDDGHNGVCETTLWHAWNDDTCIPSNVSGLDPWTDGAITPETFQPTCPLTFTVVTRGTARFRDVFGWYNVTGSKPDTGDLHVMLDCDDAAGAVAVLDVLGDPRYDGGEIGFFLATPESHAASGECAGGDCCATLARLDDDIGHVYYSERGYNPDADGADSYIHLIVFDSAITERKFYFAWEDIYGGSNNDFTDIVTSVEGVECSGGGEICDTGEPGICAQGLSACRGGALDCVGLEIPRDEACNALDDDCDGRFDEGETCPEGEVCEHGRCLPHCELGEELQCPAYTVCDHDTGHCVDPDCVGVSCPEGTRCVGGACVNDCDGIVCPHGEECHEGSCIDPCAHVVCEDGEVCRHGVCFDGCGSCSGIACTGELVCGGDGACADPSCPQGCPDGTFCSEGDCVDDCEGAVCPPGEICRDGSCCVESECGTDPEADAGTGIGSDAGGTPPGSGGCGCRSSGGGVPASPLLVLVALVAIRRGRAGRGASGRCAGRGR